MGLRPTHLGYGYQDLLTAIRLVDVVLGRATTVVVDTKLFKGDLFDDLTSTWRSGGRERLQIKHTADERELTLDSFTADRRGLRLDKVLTSINEDLRDHTDTSYRLVLRDRPPNEPDLASVLVPVDPGRDPGPVLQGLSSSRMRLDAAGLRATAPWRSSLAEIDDDALRRACEVLVVDVGMPACSLDIRSPGPAEQALLRRVADELGAGRPPNRHRAPEDVALALIEAAKAARSLNGTVTAPKLLPRLDLAVDFGAVHEGHPVDRTVEITRPAVLDRVATAVAASAERGAVVVLSGGPGIGKSWLCEQLADRLRRDWIVARHHCWLGTGDAQRDRRVLTEVVIGSLLRQLETAAPEAIAGLRPRFAATAENLQLAVVEVRRARPDSRIVLIVDGLDHVTRVLGRTEGAAFGYPVDAASVLVNELADLELPPGVALLLGSQPGDHLELLQAAAAETVPPLSRPEVRDLAERVGVLAAFPGTADRAEAERIDEAVSLIHERSRGNALYATYLSRQAVGASPALGGETAQMPTADPLHRLGDVPASANDLDAYYTYLLRGLTAEQRLAVGLLAVCDFAVTADELRKIFPVAAPMLPAALSTASLLYDGLPTVPARWGLQLCAAVDVAGAAAPWDTYLTAWEETRSRDNVDYGLDRDHDLYLAVQRGRLRLPDRRDDEHKTGSINDGTTEEMARRLAHHLARDGLPPLPRLLDVLVDGLGATRLLDGARLIDQPTRRAEVLLHLADLSAAGQHVLPSPRSLASEAWEASPNTDPLRMLRHGVPAADVADTVLGSGIDTTLRDTTAEVLRESGVDRPDVVRRWLTQITLAREVDPHSLMRLLPELEGAGFYRAWLRFAVTTVGLRRDVEAGAILPDAASTAVRVALDWLSEAAQPFTGRPRASDLWSIHSQVHQVLQEAVALLTEVDLVPALASLAAISDGTTTTSNLGTPPAGPLITTDLLALLSRTVGQASPAVLHRLTDQLRHTEVERGTPYPQLAAFELEMARISLTADNRGEALECWQRATHYMACYGSHKDSTIYELLDPLPNLAAADPAQARTRLARIRRLTYLVRQNTDGRGTSQVPVHWWRQLADLDPLAAADLAAAALLAEPGLEDARADAAHHQLLRNQAAEADPIILAALRVVAGPGGRDLDYDITLLDRLAEIPGDDLARAVGVLPVLANAISATYDDQPLMYAPDAEGPEPDRALRDATHRLGGDGAPPRPAKPETERASPWNSRSEPTLSQVLHANQRPELPGTAAGVVPAIRDYLSKPYNDDPASRRWAADALANAIGWRLLQVATEDGVDAATGLLHRVVEEFNDFSDTGVLADVAAGIDLRRDDAPQTLMRLASAAYILAFTKIRGGSGWLRFAGRDRPDLWQRALALDADTATGILAGQVAAAIGGRRYGTHGVTQAVVAAFAAQSSDPADSYPGSAFECWDAAFEVIEQRLPGSTPYDNAETYEPTTASSSRSSTDVALARLALATLAMPARDDRRRALVAATALLAARPTEAQAAISHVLATDLGAGPLTWLLTVVREGTRDGKLADDLAAQLILLARSDLLSVRALAADILANAGRPIPAPPATAAHPALQLALADALREGPA